MLQKKKEYKQTSCQKLCKPKDNVSTFLNTEKKFCQSTVLLSNALSAELSWTHIQNSSSGRKSVQDKNLDVHTRIR